MSDSPPPHKRQREQDAPGNRSDIWHDDGNAVLRAGNTLFRVHLGVLALHSQVFRDMKGLPQPVESNQPNVDGCPVIELQDDPADLTYILKALYSPTFLRQKALPFPAVSALLRLGRKYEFRELLDVAIELLQVENPTTLAEYDALLSPADGKYEGPTRIANYKGIRFDILTLARESGLMSVLPCAYLRATLSERENWVEGYRREDGTSAVLAPVDLQR